MNRLTEEYEGKVAIRKYNVAESDEGAALANEYGVVYVPTFVFVDANGKHVDTIIGTATEAALKKQLDSLK